MHRAKSITSAMLLALVLSLLAACGSSAPEGTDPNGGNQAGSTDWPRTISHAMGNTEISKQPTRVVALDNSYLDATILLNTEVVGFTTYRSMTGELPSYLGPAADTYAKNAQTVGTLTEPNLEKIAALKPDLIVSAKVRHEKIYDQLSAIAPTIMSETTGPTWQQNTTMLAKALGKETLAQSKLDTYRAAAKTVGAAANAKAGNPTISVVRFLDGPTRLYAKASFSGIVLQDMGLARPEPQDVDTFIVPISEEKIPLADADKIFITTSPSDKNLGASTREQFQRNPLWSPLAPKSVQVDDEAWMTSVSVQGAYVVMTDIAKSFDVPAPTGADEVLR